MHRIVNLITDVYRYLHPVKFAFKGKNVIIGSNCTFNSPKMIEIGNNVAIGSNVTLLSIYKKIIIKDNVIMAHNITMVSGDHNISKIGVPIINNHIKEEKDDADIIVEEDVWIGANVTILKGVTIGRGSVIGACALLIKNVLPYTIVGGVPAKVIGYRFSKKDALEHEKILYPENYRLTKDQLEHLK